MSDSRAENLIKKLISNKLSEKELLEIFAGLDSDDERQKYSDALEVYFFSLLQESELKNGSAKVQ